MPRQKKKKGATGKGLPGWLLPAFLVLLLAASLAATGYFVFLRPVRPQGKPGGAPPSKVAREAPAASRQKEQTLASKTPVLEPLDTPVTAPAPSPAPPPAAPASRPRPRIAIVIDDMGYRQDIGDQLLAMDLALSFSFLPFGPHASAQAEKARKLGRDVLLHLPLEPKDPGRKPEPGNLTVAMTRAQEEAAFSRDLAQVPMAMGINNHMGSRFTTDCQAMQTLLTLAKDRNLFFLDSLTTPESLGYELAQSMGIKSARRHIFLDNEQKPDKIVSQLEALVAQAEKNGGAIGLAHPHPATLAALKQFQAQLAGRAEVVRVSELMK